MFCDFFSYKSQKLAALPSDASLIKVTILIVDFSFWNIRNAAIWTPYVMLAAYCIEIPLFLGLSVHAYCKHRVA